MIFALQEEQFKAEEERQNKEEERKKAEHELRMEILNVELKLIRKKAHDEGLDC